MYAMEITGPEMNGETITVPAQNRKSHFMDVQVYDILVSASKYRGQTHLGADHYDMLKKNIKTTNWYLFKTGLAENGVDQRAIENIIFGLFLRSGSTERAYRPKEASPDRQILAARQARVY